MISSVRWIYFNALLLLYVHQSESFKPACVRSLARLSSNSFVPRRVAVNWTPSTYQRISLGLQSSVEDPSIPLATVVEVKKKGTSKIMKRWMTGLLLGALGDLGG